MNGPSLFLNQGTNVITLHKLKVCRWYQFDHVSQYLSKKVSILRNIEENGKEYGQQHIKNQIKHLRWTPLQKWLTSFSCRLFSQKAPF